MEEGRKEFEIKKKKGRRRRRRSKARLARFSCMCGCACMWERRREVSIYSKGKSRVCGPRRKLQKYPMIKIILFFFNHTLNHIIQIYSLPFYITF